MKCLDKRMTVSRDHRLIFFSMTRLSESLAKLFLRLNLIGLCEQNYGKPICQAFNLRLNLSVNLRERLCK